MKHSVKKIKFSKGKDSHEALVRKLVTNFIQNGKIETTLSRAKVLKSTIDSLVYKAIQNKESDRNVLLKHLGDKNVVMLLVKDIAPVFSGRVGGYVRLARKGIRQGDNAEIVQVTWSEEVLKKTAEGKKEKKDQKKPIKKQVSKIEKRKE